MFGRFRDEVESDYSDYAINDFIVSDSKIERLTKNDEPFNYQRKIIVPKNFEILQNNSFDIYTSGDFDEKFYLNKYKIDSCQVRLDRLEVSKHLKKINKKKRLKSKKEKSKKKKRRKKQDQECSFLFQLFLLYLCCFFLKINLKPKLPLVKLFYLYRYIEIKILTTSQKFKKLNFFEFQAALRISKKNLKNIL